MKFDVEIIIRTRPDNKPFKTELVETATVNVEAGTYTEALERTFTALKTCDNFQAFMDKVNMDGIKYPQS